MTDPTTPQDYARWLRDIADRLDAPQDGPDRARLQALVADRGLVRLTHELAHDVRTDLGTWSEALRAEPATGILHDFGTRIAMVEDHCFDFMEDAGSSMVTVERMMAHHPSPADAAMARRAHEQRLWDGPEVRGDERVYLVWPDGSQHAPVRGLAPAVHGDADSYGAPLFTREGAERIVSDMLSDDAGFTAAFQPDGSLVYTWPAEYDGGGGRAHVEPDDRGLYAIGGQWPWDYCRPGNSYLAPRAEAARIISITPVPGKPHASAPLPTSAVPAPGRHR
ncbi:hypothetical protein [Kitasatospora sp. NPDC098663]|uniref:hypothetical protein n=1 Tax=Kitasatospora sp. NPDC098663 TaxID=3364096 RepID=UPI003826DB04